MTDAIKELIFLTSSINPNQINNSFDFIKSFLNPNEASPKSLYLAMCEGIQEIVSKNNITELTVPVSIGFDSRFILGCLLDFFEQDKLDIFTAGIPGNYEYEFAPYIFKKSIPKHYLLDLTNYEWNTDEIVAQLKKNNDIAVIWNWPNFLSELKPPIIHGYMGDALAGDHLFKQPSNNILNAFQYFLLKNKSILAKKYNIDIKLALKEYSDDFITNNNIDLIVDFLFRQEQRIRPYHLEKEGKVIYPFMQPSVIYSFLALDYKQKMNESFYTKVVKESCPKIFPELKLLHIQSKKHYKIWKYIFIKCYKYFKRKKLHGAMYDWKKELITNKSLRKETYKNLNHLQSENIELPWKIDQLLKRFNDEEFIANNFREYHYSLFISFNHQAGNL